MKTRYSKIFLALKTAMIVPIGLALVSGAANAQTKTSVASTNWATGSTWTTAGQPAAGDTAIIANTFNVAVTGNKFITDTQVNTGGTLTLSGTGVLNASGTVTNNGTLALTNAGNNVYVGTGYTNIAMSSGNTFNPLAGITGSGRVLAMGDLGDGGVTNDGSLRQSISGGVAIQAGVTSGTLTLNNVHVGAAAQNVSYTIENEFSQDSKTVATISGPAIESAIKYSDTGLTGTGATPGNHIIANGFDSGLLTVTRSGTTAGIVDGQTIKVVSNLGDSQTINISGGNVYQYAAVGSSTSTAVTVGAQHVGNNNAGGVAAAISLQNGNSAGASVQETLGTTASVLNGAAVVVGTNFVSGILGGATDTSLKAGVNTATAALNKTGTLHLANVSEGLAGSGFGNSNIGTGTNVSVTGSVYNFASGGLNKTSGQGTIGGSGTSYTLDFGTVAKNSTQVANLNALNIGASLFQDGLHGAITPLSGNHFSVDTGVSSFDLAIGALAKAFALTFDTSSSGSFSQIFDFKWNGVNSNIAGFTGTSSDILLTVNGFVQGGSSPTPEPGILWLFGSAGLAWFATGKKKAEKA